MRRAISLLVLVGIVALAGCGVPNDSKPRTIPVGQVPFDLLAPSTTESPTTIAVTTVKARVYLVVAQHLVGVDRTVASPPSLGSVLATLIQGPNDDEVAQGVRSALNPQARVLSVQQSGAVVLINVNDTFAGADVQSQIVALAQIVYTATERPGVDAVQIMVDSQPVDVPRGDGSSTKETLRRSDYAALAPL